MGPIIRLPPDVLASEDFLANGRSGPATPAESATALPSSASSPTSPDRPALRRALRDFYEAEARADIGRWMPRYLPSIPRAPRRVQLKTMSSQWGSLAPDGTVALDLSLVLAPPDAFEYVLVHELCHLIHHNHSPAYWHEVEARFPAWRDQRDYFREHGRQLKATLQALLR